MKEKPATSSHAAIEASASACVATSQSAGPVREARGGAAAKVFTGSACECG